MIRILHVVASLNIGAGMTNVVMNHFKNLYKENVIFDFLYFDETNGYTFKDEIAKYGGSFFFIDKKEKRFLKKIKLFIRDNAKKYNAIHCHPAYSWFVCTHFAKKNGIKKRIVHSHSIKYSNKILSKIRNFISGLLCTFSANLFIAVNEESKRLFPLKRKAKVMALKNGIDIKRFLYSKEKRNIIRETYGIQKTTKIITHVGRFSYEKNHSFIIEMFKKILEKDKNYYMFLIGDGVLYSDVKLSIVSNHLEKNIFLLGRKDNVEDFLSATDYFILPSLYEGAPVSLIEAQASGLDCFVSFSVPKSNTVLNTYRLPLNKGTDYWSEIILKYQPNCSKNRRKTNEAMIQQGFDSKTNSNILLNLYLE